MKEQFIRHTCTSVGIFVCLFTGDRLLGYWMHGTILPLFGQTPMAFSTAICLFLLGIAIFLMGWERTK